MEKGIFDIEFVRVAIENIINDSNYSLASFYEQITEAEEIERYVSKYQDILDEVNKTDRKAAGVVVMDGNGAITNLKSTYICPFEFTVQLGTKLQYRDEVLEKVREVQNRLKGRKLDIALLNTGALVVVETADGETPKDNDYLGSISSTSALNSEVPELIKNVYGEISIISGTYETITITANGGVATSGDFKITLEGSDYVIPLSVSTHDTAEKVANKIYGELLNQGIFANWSVDVAGAVVTLTAKTYGAKDNAIISNTTTIVTPKVVKWTVDGIPTKSKTITAFLPHELPDVSDYQIDIAFDIATDTTINLTAEKIRTALSSSSQTGWEISGSDDEIILTYLGVVAVPDAPYFDENELVEKSMATTSIQFTGATEKLTTTDWSLGLILNGIPYYLKSATLGQATNEDDFAMGFDSILRNNAWNEIDGLGEKIYVTEDYDYTFDEASNRVILTSKVAENKTESELVSYTKSNAYQEIEFDFALTSPPYFGSRLITFSFAGISYNKTIDLSPIMSGSPTAEDVVHFIVTELGDDTTLSGVYGFSHDLEVMTCIALSYGKKGDVSITAQPLFLLYEKTIINVGSLVTIPPDFTYNLVFRQYGYEEETILELTTTIVEEGSVVNEDIIDYNIETIKGTIVYEEGEYVPSVGEVHYVSIGNTLLRKIIFNENQTWQVVDGGVPTHTAFYKYKLDLSFNAFKCEEPYTLNADDLVTIVFSGAATVVKSGVVLGNDIVKTKIALSGFENTNSYEIEPLDFPSNIDTDGIEYQLRGNRFKKTRSKTSLDGGFTFTLAADMEHELLNYFFLYGRYGKWSTATISPNSKYTITETLSSWGQVQKNSTPCSLRKVDIQNTESDVLNLVCVFNYEGEGQ